MTAVFAGNVIETDLADEMRDAFVPYAMSVIMDRALPDVRDGLKPVQRRILFTGDQMGLAPGSKTRKSARVVGEVMGKYHPHGDSAVYDALVRLAQDHTMRLPLIDPQGNFGSLDDGAAAARYTECRLSTAAVALLAELGEDTVDFMPNFDGELQEPVVLPAAIPNLLVNGSDGIAVGLATSIPPHNLAEVRDVIRLLMTKRRPKPTISEVLALLPGPDFPGGGTVVRNEEFEEMYTTGRGTLKVRAGGVIDKVGNRRQGIIVTELPYMVGPENVVAKIQGLMEAGKLGGVSDVKNLTDRHGIRIQITCKVGANPEAVLQDLYRLTPMQTTVRFNANVLVNGLPRQLGIIEMCELFIEHRMEIIVRRTNHRLAKAEARAHIVAGLLKALNAIDQVVKIIRGSQDTAEARSGLMEALRIDEVQADHILELQLRRLAKLEKAKLEKEQAELKDRIAAYKVLLGSEQRQRTLLLKELDDQVEQLGTDRRTRVVTTDQVAVAAQSVVLDDLSDDPCVVELSVSGLIARGETPARLVRPTPGRHDVLVTRAQTSLLSPVMALTSSGQSMTVRPAELPEMQGRSRGVKTAEAFPLRRNEKVVAVLAAPVEDESILVVTAEGRAKRLGPDEYATATKADTTTVFGFRTDTDRVVAAFLVRADSEVLLVTDTAQVLRCRADGAPAQGLGASGALMMNVGDGRIIGGGVAADEAHLIVVTNTGSAKVTPLTEIPTKGARGGGVRLGRFRQDESSLTAAAVLVPDIASALDENGSPQPITIPPSSRGGTYHPDYHWTMIGEIR